MPLGLLFGGGGGGENNYAKFSFPSQRPSALYLFSLNVICLSFSEHGNSIMQVSFLPIDLYILARQEVWIESRNTIKFEKEVREFINDNFSQELINYIQASFNEGYIMKNINYKENKERVLLFTFQHKLNLAVALMKKMVASNMILFAAVPKF